MQTRPRLAEHLSDSEFLHRVRVEPVIAGGLTQAQWIAIALGVIGLILLRWSPGGAEPEAVG